MTQSKLLGLRNQPKGLAAWLITIIGFLFISFFVGIFVIVGLELIGDIATQINKLENWPRWLLSLFVGCASFGVYIYYERRKNHKQN